MKNGLNLRLLCDKKTGRIFSASELYLFIVSVSILLWHFAQYLASSTTLPIYWHILLCAVIFIITYIRPVLGLRVLIFLLPFLTGFIFHVGIWFNKQIPIGINIWTMDAGCGFILGLFILYLCEKRKKNITLDYWMPKQWLWSIAVIQAFFIVSAAISISRNLNQTTTPWTLRGILFNLIHIQSLGWHDDFYPLRDLMIFSMALLLFLYLVRFFRDKNIEDIFAVVSPLLYANIITVGYAFIQKIHTIGFYNTPERGINSFFPDIHSFGGYELICFAISMTGTLTKKNPLWLYVSGCIIGCCGLILSDSRFAIVSLILLYFSVLLLFRRDLSRKRILQLLTGVMLIIMIAGGFYFFSKSGHILQTFLYNTFILNYNIDINSILGYRPEMWKSAFTMYSNYPLCGLGLSSFNRSSSIVGFSTSNFLINNHGENCHNYFIQIVTEIGCVGVIILLLPFFFLKNGSRHARVILALLISIILGNVYGHELLLREYLVILVVVLGFLFATGEVVIRFKYLWNWRNNRISSLLVKCFIGSVLIIIVTAGYEVYGSFNKTPFIHGYLCGQFPYEETVDKWVPITHEYVVRKKHKEVLFKIRIMQSKIISRPVVVRYGYRTEKANIDIGIIEISDDRFHDIKIKNYDQSADIAVYYFNTDQCFVPKSWGINTDNRRLAIKIDEVVIDPLF